jgi:hypothetical protein
MLEERAHTRQCQAAFRLLGQATEEPESPCDRKRENRGWIDLPLEPENACADRQIALGTSSLRIHADDQVLNA